MVDCKACRHWDVFLWKATILHRVDEGFWEEPISEHIETCGKGLSVIEDGRTVSTIVQECSEFRNAWPW